MRSALGAVTFIFSIILALYVSVWMMIVQPIMNACIAFDAGQLTAAIIGSVVLKFIFASAIGSLIMWIGTTITGLLMK